jgi:hypothetical protein
LDLRVIALAGANPDFLHSKQFESAAKNILGF